MIKVLFDAQIFMMERWGGGSRYYVELMRRFVAGDAVEIALPACVSDNAYLREFAASHPGAAPKPGRPWCGRSLSWRLSRERAAATIRRGDFTLLHPTYYHPYFLDSLGGKPFVLTIFDMAHERFPELFPEDDRSREWKAGLAARATRIIAISRSTKADIVRFLGIDDRKIAVIPLGGPSWGQTVPARPADDLPARYILYVGARHAYKNFPLFLAAIAPLLRQDPTLSVLCAGGGAFRAAERSLLRRLHIDARVRGYPGITDARLSHLYARALAFVFPSRHEGFGLPVLEAFAAGCPAVLSRAGALPEVGGDAADYFDPHDPLSLQQAVARVISDENRRVALRRRGREQLAAFSWEKTAAATVDLYRDASR